MNWVQYIFKPAFSDSLQNNTFLCNMKIFTLMIRKIPHLRLEESWRQQWLALQEDRHTGSVLAHSLSVSVRWSIAKIHLAPQPGARQLCLVSETLCRFLWKSVSPPKEDVSFLLPELLDLLKCLSGSSQHIVKSQNKWDYVEDFTCLFQQTAILMVNMP